MGDVLEADFTKYVENAKVVANIPYYITSPIVNKIIDNRAVIFSISYGTERSWKNCAKNGKERSVLTSAAVE